MKLLQKVLVVIFSIMMSCCVFVACNATSSQVESDDDASIIIQKAVDKLDSISENMFSVIESNETNPTQQQVSTYSNTKVNFAPYTYSVEEIPDDEIYHPITKDNYSTLVARQLFVNYPYNIVNYILQNTTKAHNKYNHKYKMGTTVYGVATKTINNDINEIFSQPNIEDPILAIKVEKEQDGISFIADWDWRNSYMEENFPRLNSVITTNCKIEYNKNKKEVTKIRMNWYWTELNGDFMACVMDFEKNEFYFMEGWRSEIWYDISNTDSLPCVFNDGSLTYDKIKNYPYSGMHILKSNITNDIDELDFVAYRKNDSNLNSIGGLTENSGTKETEFAKLYNEIYDNVKDFSMRNEKNYMSLSDAIEVDYMNDASRYGYNTTAFVSTQNGVHFLYISEEELREILDQLSKKEEVVNDNEKMSFITGVNDCLNSFNGRYVGELGEYNGKTYTLSYVFNNLYWENCWEHSCEEFLYRITDGVNTLTFERKNKKLTNVSINDLLIISDKGEELNYGFQFEENPDGNSYAVYYNAKSTETNVNIEIPASYKGKPVTKIKRNGFLQVEINKLTIPNSIKVIEGGFSSIKIVDFLGSVDEWASIVFDSSYDTRVNPTYYARDLYINGELLTSATINAPVINKHAFTYCLSLENVVINSNKIDDYAFINCQSLSNVVFSDNIDFIGANSFSLCKSLGIEYENAYYVGTQSNPYKILIRASSTNITSITLHDDTEIISGYAFNQCAYLRSIELNNKLLAIGEWAFNCGRNLENLVIPASVIEFSATMFGPNGFHTYLVFEQPDNYGYFEWYYYSEYIEHIVGSKLMRIEEREFYNYLGRLGDKIIRILIE